MCIRDRVNNYQLELGKQSARFRQSTRKIQIDDVLARLDESALVDFLTFRKKDDSLALLAVVANQEGLNVIQYEDLEMIQAIIMELREIIQDEGAEDEDVKSVAYDLWEILWSPLNEYIGETESIFISPDSVLNVLPFDALTDEDDSYLLENYDLKIISSEGIWLLIS